MTFNEKDIEWAIKDTFRKSEIYREEGGWKQNLFCHYVICEWFLIMKFAWNLKYLKTEFLSSLFQLCILSNKHWFKNQCTYYFLLILFFYEKMFHLLYRPFCYSHFWRYKFFHFESSELVWHNFRNQIMLTKTDFVWKYLWKVKFIIGFFTIYQSIRGKIIISSIF